MRDAPVIQDIWDSGGPFSAHTIVTVQESWGTSDPAVVDGDENHVIHPTTTTGVGLAAERGVPIRWYQKADNSQIEREIPNVRSVSIDRSIETDAATCNIVIDNQWMYDNGAVPLDQLAEGNRYLQGYFTPTRGVYPDSQARWGHVVNEWENILAPNAILRTYQGYGGHDKTLAQCITDGNLILTGVWLVDDINITTAGTMTMDCRDMAKLLVEQQLFPPLIPADRYPLTYYRWVYDNFAVSASTQNVTISNTVDIPTGNKRAVYRDSSTDRWYGANTVLHGHTGTDSLDGNTSTYWLSVGNAGPDRAFATDWIEYDCGEMMNAVYVHPWAGNYTMYVSVMENGKWQGSSTVPYNPAELYGNQPTVVDTGANIPYVKSFGVPWEKGGQFILPRAYNAQRVRVSFRHLAYSGIGPWQYRAGVREFRIRGVDDVPGSTTTTSNTWTVSPILFAADTHPVSGYVTVTNLWQIDAFGDAREQIPDAAASTGVTPVSLVVTPSGNGYYVLDQSGDILTYGDANHIGDPKDDGFDYAEGVKGATDIALTPTGNGYWVIGYTDPGGVLYTYGDAPNLGYPVPTGESALQQITGTPSGNGYWITDMNGVVTAYGDAVNYGSYSETSLNFSLSSTGYDEIVSSFRATPTGNGYWILTNTGRVQAFGDAVDYGQNTVIPTESLTLLNMSVNLLPSPDGTGYIISRGDGYMTPHGEVDLYGGPVVGSTGQVRNPGNYLDYADIIKDLALWAGFLFYDDSLASNVSPSVYGNIESTGAYAKEKLPDEIFDKRPVIDAMTEIKEVVGYLLYVDDEGGLRFESPNFWSYGNFLQSTGERVYEIPEIDERVNLFNFGASRNDDSLRSLIIISSEDPIDSGETTVTTKLVPQTAQGLRGIHKPAMWVNGWFQDADEQQIMAELISMHIWFAQRVGQVTCVANPAIQINDQVRIFERQSSEVFLHYVRGINTTHDLDSGEYTMTLTTHWLGTGDDWAITDDPAFLNDEAHFVISQKTKDFINKANNSANVFDSIPTGPSFIGVDPLGPDGNPASGSGPEN